ncbi:MAG: PD-(D/E)XK nuclease family protein [Elusimicrobia bacterium]|nr:PD-(D/E)XK nuclease family protein [Elusimicrobiota bacterium]
MIAHSFKLSATALSLFRNCPRCFWLEKIKNIKRPRGIFPSLPSGMDRILKNYFDFFRKDGILPSELQVEELKETFLFQDQSKLDAWRNWRTGLTFEDEDGSCLIGAFDDLLIKDGLTIPFDYKTKGSPAEKESAARYYQKQLDCYALLLQSNGIPTADYGYLLFYSPKDVQEDGKVLFNVQPIRLGVNPERAKELFRQAVQTLKAPIPDSDPECEYCLWLQNNE